ncbi:MAG: hypothetical protein LIP18_05275 [Planctomycetes bacterium]|nr:hypothetical protein [Planctomycetota bacterium]MCD7896366.1 hypothetical protein [Planctomycetaceae bacterium]
MCGAALIPVAGLVSSLFGGRSSNQGVQSYTPQEIEMTPNHPDPTPQEPTLGVDNSDTSGKQASQGKGSLVITKRNPGVTVGGAAGGSGVNVVGR